MTMPRREFLVAGIAALAPIGRGQAAAARTEKAPAMYGLIGKLTAVAGQRDALAAILLGSTGTMPGCLSYVIATDPADGLAKPGAVAP